MPRIIRVKTSYNLFCVLCKVKGQDAVYVCKKTGKKDIIKIDRNIEIDLEKLGFIDSNITVNIVKDDVIIEKRKLSLPERVINIAICKNPRCITSIEKSLDQVFNLADGENKIYRCKYCEMSLNVN